MARFPEVDIAGATDIANSIVMLDSYEFMHQTAEQASDLYKVGHAIIRAALTQHNVEGRIGTAILSGVGAYEIFGSMVQSSDELAKYRFNDLLDKAGGSEGVIDTFAAFDDAYESTVDVPELRSAIRLIVANTMPDSSPELVERGVQGAAMLRTLQLEVEDLLDMRAEFERIVE